MCLKAQNKPIFLCHLTTYGVICKSVCCGTPRSGEPHHSCERISFGVVLEQKTVAAIISQNNTVYRTSCFFIYAWHISKHEVKNNEPTYRRNHHCRPNARISISLSSRSAQFARQISCLCVKYHSQVHEVSSGDYCWTRMRILFLATFLENCSINYSIHFNSTNTSVLLWLFLKKEQCNAHVQLTYFKVDDEQIFPRKNCFGLVCITFA